ncbi:MAG: hypothetical protein P9M14_11295 [Candidatus Alcyoniella australis]|nr:hypothetical protein [Candidatus Alcyoniella australis]
MRFGWWIYLIRGSWPLLVLAMALKLRLSGFFPDGQISNELFFLVEQLDLYRELFYALLPAAVVALLVPGSRRDDCGWSWPILALTCLAAVVAAGLIVSAVELRRPGAFRVWTLVCAVYVGFNLWAALYFYIGGRLGEKLRRALVRGVLIADLFAPTLVWAAYRRRVGPRLIPLRVLPALLLLVVPFLPWIIAPGPFDPQTAFGPALTRLDPREYYQVIIDRQNGGLILSTNNDGLFKIDQRSGERLASNFDFMPNMQGVGYNERRGLVVLCNLNVGRTLLVRAADLRTVRDVRIDNPLDLVDRPPGGHLWRTAVRPDDGSLISYCMRWLVLLNPQADRIEATYNASIAYYALDPARDELHLSLFDPGALVALDARTLTQRRRIAIPPFADRIGFDPQTDRVLVALPLQGQVLVVDAATYETTALIDSLPGVRALHVDVPGRRLLLGGFGPYLELRSLDDLSLIDRIYAPPWVRWFDVDDQGRSVYFTSTHCGVFRLDFDRLGPGTPGHWARTHDPFFMLASAGSRAVQALFGLGLDY